MVYKILVKYGEIIDWVIKSQMEMEMQQVMAVMGIMKLEDTFHRKAGQRTLPHLPNRFP